MTQWIDEIYDGLEVVDAQQRALYNLANSFYRTGNETMYDHLCDIAQNLIEAAKQIDAGVHGQVNYQRDQVNKMTGTILSAALNVGEDRLKP